MKRIKEFFFLNLNQYENLEMSFPIGMLVIALALAISLISIYYYYHKIYTCALLRALRRHEATTEETAKTLKELRLNDNSAIKRALQKRNLLTTLVIEVGKVTPTYEEYVKAQKKKHKRAPKTDFSKARFYLNCDKKDIAETQIERCPSLLTPVLTCVISFLLLVALFFFLAPILESINAGAK